MIPAPAGHTESPKIGTANDPTPQRRSLISDALAVATLSVVARIAGAVKTIAGAYYFRPGAELDAFLLAFLVPSFLGDILAGAIGLALVPALSSGTSQETSGLYAEALYRMSRLLGWLALIAAAVALFMPGSVVPKTFAPQWHAARPLLLAMLPLLPLMGIAAVWRSVLHARMHFRVAALAPVLTPALTVAFLPLAPRIGAMALALGTTLGMLAEAVFLGTALTRRGIPLFPRRTTGAHWTLRGALGQYAALVAGNVMMRGSAAVDQAAAAMLGAGALSTLSYGTRLASVLVAIGPGSIGTTVVPRFATAIAAGERARLRRTLILTLAACCGLAAGLVVIFTAASEPLTRLFLLRGVFTASDVHQVALVQTFSLLQLPLAVALAILSGVVAALRINHSMLPVWAVALALHCALDFYFFKPLGVRGIVLSTTVVQAFLVLALALLVSLSCENPTEFPLPIFTSMPSALSPAAATVYDPLGYTVPLPLRCLFYPLGFPLEVFTNSADILAAAERAWGGLTSISDATPVILRVQVTAGNGGQLPPPVTPRGQGHLISITFSPDHFAVCDVARGYAFVSITDDAARDIEWTRYHFLEPLGWLMIDAMHAVAIHASSIALAGRAVLLCGDSGSGKTTLACACGRRGWTFLSGDATHLLRDQTGFEVRGRPGQIRLRASARELFPELAEASVAIRPNGKPDIETTPALLGLPVSQRAEANCIVFLDRTVFPDRNAATTPALHPYPKAAAAARLNNLICFGDEHIQREQRKTLEHFLSLPLFRLSYSEPASAELALRALIERGN